MSNIRIAPRVQIGEKSPRRNKAVVAGDCTVPRAKKVRPKTQGVTPLPIPQEWSFSDPSIAAAFDSHVREQLPWYELATGAMRHLARHYLPEYGTVIDVGASTGNVARALFTTLQARTAELVAIERSQEMVAVYEGPGQLICCDACEFDFAARKPDLIVCFLSLMFLPIPHRRIVIERMRRALRPGGAIIVFDKMLPRDGYLGTVLYRLTLAAKHEAGASAEDVIRKELSIAGIQRPMSESELDGFVEVFRFGDFAGFVYEA